MRRTSLLVLLTAFVSLTTAAEPAKDAVPAWVHWRGPSGQGYTEDTRVPLTWSEKENVLWKTKLPGRGNSSPVVWGDRVFLTASSDRGDERYVLCVRTTDGELLWKHTAAKGVAPEKSHSWNGYASPSCTTDGKHVYAFFGTPGLFCYDFDGKQVWKHAFGTFVSQTGWGTGASPFLYEDLVIQNCDNDGKGAGDAPQALVALDKATGAVRWTTPRNLGRGFSTPRLIPVAGGRVDLVLNGPTAVVGYDPKTGKELWRSVRTTGGDSNLFGEPLPVNDGEMMFVLSGRPGPCQALRLPEKGDVTKTHVLWQNERRNHRDVSSPILWEGLVYQADNKGMLTCIEAKTGKQVYNEALAGRDAKSLSSPIVVRGKLLFPLDEGTTVVLEPGRTFRVVGRNKLDGGTLEYGASPAVADGKLYLRSQSYLYCVGAK
jgi:outer membrane protein assembly factor BamB